MRWCFGVIFLALLGIPCAFAQNETFTAKPDQSEVTFSLGDVMHSVHGTFHVESGSVLFDPVPANVRFHCRCRRKR